MAVKIDKPVDPAQAAASAAASAAAADAATLEVLHPERAIEIAGRTVVVREYTYVEGMYLQAGAAVFLDDLYLAFARDGAAPMIDEVNAVLGKHIFVVQWLIAHAITPLSDEKPDAFYAAVKDNARWVGQLDDVEGDLLSVAWWGVNRGFFTRRLQRRARSVQAASDASSASPRSTPP